MVATIRNKSNPFFAKENHRKLAKNQKNKLWVDVDGPLPPDGGSFSPLSLFYDMLTGAQVADGVWFDPSDRTTLFEDVAGTIPATLPGQPVGLMLDKSDGLVLGQEIAQPFNSPIWTGRGNPESITEAGFTTAAAGGVSMALLTVGKWYEISVAGTVTGGPLNIHNGIGSGNIIVSNVGQVAKKLFFQAIDVNFYLRMNGAGTLSGGSISVRELPGYHATQPVAASRPTLARHPKGGRRNMALYSEAFASGEWQKTGIASSSGNVLREDTSSGLHRMQTAQFFTIPGVAHTLSVKLEKTSARRVYVNMDVAIGAGCLVDLATGAVVATAGAGFVAAFVEDAGSAWIVRMTGTGTGVASRIYLQLCLPTHATASDNTYLGDGASSVRFDYVQLEPGAVATPYQKVTSQYDVTEAGVPDCWGLMFDGVDDFLVTPAIDLTGTDKVGVFAGVRKLSDAGNGVVYEFSAAADGNTGAFYLRAPSGAQPNYQYLSRGTLTSAPAAGGMPAPHTGVVTGLSSISGDSVDLRVNGALATQASLDQGTGNYGNYPLYIGRRGGTSLPFNGLLYGLIIPGKLPSAAEITNTETFLNSKMGAF